MVMTFAFGNQMVASGPHWWRTLASTTISPRYPGRVLDRSRMPDRHMTVLPMPGLDAFR